MNENLRKSLKILFPSFFKEKENPGVIGHYDCKPFHNFKYALIYADEIEIFNNEKVEAYARNYKGTTFVNVLVFNEDGFDPAEFTFDKLYPLIKEKEIEDTKRHIVVICFQKNNENTIKMAKSFCNSTKTSFEHALVFNPQKVHMDFYKPVPVFYKLYDHYCEDIYFDLAFIDDKRE